MKSLPARLVISIDAVLIKANIAVTSIGVNEMNPKSSTNSAI